jgi:adenylyltransferase/sulfurtransferase
MRLRNKKKDCIICGENPTMTGLIDYVEFCNEQANDAVRKKYQERQGFQVDLWLLFRLLKNTF